MVLGIDLLTTRGGSTQIVSAEAQALAVDSHVCELQLILRSFAEMKVPH